MLVPSFGFQGGHGSQTAAAHLAERVPIPSFGQMHRRGLCLCRIMTTTYDAIQKKGVCPCRHRRRREPATLSALRCAPGKRCSRSLPACSSRLVLSPSRRPRSSRWTCLSTVSASRPTSCARRCSACLAAPTWSASLPRVPIPSLSPSSAWRFAPRVRPVWCAPSWRTTWCPRAPRRLRLIMPRPCSVASVPRRAACASSTRWASSGSALPIRRQTPSASSCSWSSTSAWASIFLSSACLLTQWAMPSAVRHTASRSSSLSSITPTRCATSAASAPNSTRCAPSTARTTIAARSWPTPR